MPGILCIFADYPAFFMHLLIIINRFKNGERLLHSQNFNS